MMPFHAIAVANPNIQHLNFKRKQWNGEIKEHPVEETPVPKKHRQKFSISCG